MGGAPCENANEHICNAAMLKSSRLPRARGAFAGRSAMATLPCAALRHTNIELLAIYVAASKDCLCPPCFTSLC